MNDKAYNEPLTTVFSVFCSFNL